MRFFQRSLRVSLTIWYVAAIMVVLSSYALVVFAFVERDLSNALDERLRDDFHWATAMADEEPDGTLRWFDADGSWAGDENGPWLTVWSDGHIIFRTAVAERTPIPGTDLTDHLPDERITTVPIEGLPSVRVLRGQSDIHGRTVVLQVARSEAAMRGQLKNLALLLLLGLPIGVAAAGAGGYFLARRALSPIGQMAKHARAITADRLSDRLPVGNPNDELGRLASVFNATLARLESSFEHTRRFAADVSHQIRTPLMAIRAVGDVALRERRDPAAYRAVISSMLEEVDRLGQLVNQLLTLSRGEMGQSTVVREPLNLCALAEEVASQLGVLAEEKEQSLIVEPHGEPHGVGDHVAIRQSVMNLVDNAIKYTPRGGHVRIRVWASSTAAVLEVHDDGPGIPQEARLRIFDRFARAGAPLRPDETGGFGLGLSIARWAVEASGGELLLEPVPGAGSTFRISLPLADPARPAVSRRTA